ncbi:MAG TPA: polyphosphate kinase 1 [Gemmatimonadaceae bacterium]|nr:polyphosphate kinase 1 [Gemmatimonadaceae bacterium]
MPQYLNPELSLLAFQERVLALAEDARTPLGERLKFLAIVSMNIDDFFMVRMSGLLGSVRELSEEQCEDGMTRGEQRRCIKQAVSSIVSRQDKCWLECSRLLGELGAGTMKWSELSEPQQLELREQCMREIQPDLSPLAMTLSPGHPLPHLPHLSLSIAVVFRGERGGRLHMAQLELPDDVPRFFHVPGLPGRVIAIEEVVRSNLDLVYPGGQAEDAYVFRVTRGGDLALNEDAAADLLEAVAAAAELRPGNPAIRVEVEKATPEFVRELILESLSREVGASEVGLRLEDFEESEGLLDLRSLRQIEIPGAKGHSYTPHSPVSPISTERSIFELIAERELLFHHPFDSFSGTVLRFLEEAASDAHVTTIKLTLYRTGNPSPIVEALLEAAARGIRVIAFVELKARFDEEHNVTWARALENAGGHVIYGYVGLKNHAKAALVVRRERGGLQRYAHVGTGNYNTRSGREYTDLSLLTARPTLTADIADLFNGLTGASTAPSGLSRGALIAPNQLLHALLEQIDAEAAHARAGRPARITFKLNGLSDADVVRALYRASHDGVDIDLIVRGICTLRPGMQGLSERIRVVSVVGRFLEHSRIYRFLNGGSARFYIGSSDLRPRNLRRRVELLAPVIDPDHRARLDSILETYLGDTTAWELRADGSYAQRSGNPPGAQERLIVGEQPLGLHRTSCETVDWLPAG